MYYTYLLAMRTITSLSWGGQYWTTSILGLNNTPPHDTICIAILLPRFNIFNTIHFEEETIQTIEERKYFNKKKCKWIIHYALNNDEYNENNRANFYWLVIELFLCNVWMVTHSFKFLKFKKGITLIRQVPQITWLHSYLVLRRCYVNKVNC